MQVTVYTTPSCPQCEMTKKVLNKGNIRYNIVDLSTDEKAMEYVKQDLGYASAPVVMAGKEHWSGFRHGYLQNLIKIVHGEEAHSKPAQKETVAA
jgi:glutaredoxin-like protein NrdH